MDKEKAMQLALEEAQKGFNQGEIPIGAIVVLDDQIIGSSFNRREEENKISAHAEILAMEQASKVLGTWKLCDCELYTTLEPCLMCYAAIKQSRIKKVYIALEGNKNKEYTYTNFINKDKDFEYDICAQQSKDLLMKFFQGKRN